MSNPRLFCLLSASLFFAGTSIAEEMTLRTRQVLVRFDDRMQRHMEWLEAGNRSIVAFDPSAQDGLTALGTECTAFRLEPGSTQNRVLDPEFGGVLEAKLAGVFEDDRTGLRIRREVLLPIRQNLLARRNRLGERPMMFEIPAAEAWDIDEELDFGDDDIDDMGDDEDTDTDLT